MTIHLAQLTSASEKSTFSDLLVYQLTGFMIVLLVLCSLWIAITLLGRLFKFLDLKDPVTDDAPKQAVISEVSTAQSSSSIQVTPELMAVIGAALHTVIKGPFKIVSVQESKKESKSS